MSLPQRQPSPGLPTLAELAADPGRAWELPPEAARDLLARVVGLQTVLLARALSPAIGSDQAETQGEDRLLNAKEAAQLLGVSKDTLYRKKWPFEVRPTPGTRRFSTRGIARYIRQRQG